MSGEMKLLTVVVPCHNSEQYLQKCVSSVTFPRVGFDLATP